MNSKNERRSRLEPGPSHLQHKLFEIIFGWQTGAGKWFDIILLMAIVASVVALCLTTVQSIGGRSDPATGTAGGPWEYHLYVLEWIFTILFTIEYLVRLYCVKRPSKYAFSFFGIVDLLAILPTYLLLVPFFAHTLSFGVLRLLRLLRVFRILNLNWLMREADDLGKAVVYARAKIVVFLGVVLIAVTIAGTLVYEIEQGPESNFNSIPDSIYWAIVTMTTVGYGDIVPVSAAGKFVSAILILLGYSLIIVPTGFVSAELMEAKMEYDNTTCPTCNSRGHRADAKFCRYCATKLERLKS